MAHQNSIDITRVIAIIQIVFLVLFFVMAQAVERLMAADFVIVGEAPCRRSPRWERVPRGGLSVLVQHPAQVVSGQLGARLPILNFSRLSRQHCNVPMDAQRLAAHFPIRAPDAGCHRRVVT